VVRHVIAVVSWIRPAAGCAALRCLVAGFPMLRGLLRSGAGRRR